MNLGYLNFSLFNNLHVKVIEDITQIQKNQKAEKKKDCLKIHWVFTRTFWNILQIKVMSQLHNETITRIQEIHFCQQVRKLHFNLDQQLYKSHYNVFINLNEYDVIATTNDIFKLVTQRFCEEISITTFLKLFKIQMPDQSI